MTRQETAQTLALQCLAWLAADDERLGAFLAETGIDPAALRRRAGDPLLLAAVMDHLLAEDARLLDCAAALSVAPEHLAGIRVALPGGDVPHWT